MSQSLLLLLALLVVVVAVAARPVQPSKRWIGAIPNCVAFNNGSVFAAGLNEMSLASAVYRLNPNTGHLQQTYHYQEDFSAQFLWASSSSIFVTGSTLHGYVTVETDIATGHSIRNSTDAPGLDIRGVDSAGKVAVAVDDTAVYTYSTDTWKQLDRYDGGIKNLQVVGTAIHPNNSHVYVLNMHNWELVEIRPNNTVARYYSLQYSPSGLYWFTIDEEARHAFFMVVMDGGFGIQQLDLVTEEVRFLSSLEWGKYEVYAQFAARSEGMGEAWIAENENTESLIRMRTAKVNNVTSFPLTPYPIIRYAKGLALSSDGQSAYISNVYQQQVVRVNATNGHLISRFAPIATNDNNCSLMGKIEQELAVDSRDQIYFPLCNGTILVYTPEGAVSRMIVLADNTTNIRSVAPAPNGVLYLTDEKQLNFLYQVDEKTGKVLSSRQFGKTAYFTDLLYDAPTDSLWVVDREATVYQFTANSSWTLLRQFDLTGEFKTALSHVAVDHVHERVVISQWMFGPGTLQTTQLVWLDMSGKATANFTFGNAPQQAQDHYPAGVAVNAKGDVYAVGAGVAFGGLLVFDNVKVEEEQEESQTMQVPTRTKRSKVQLRTE